MVQHQAKEVLELLKSHGFEEIRVTGDHHRYSDGKGHRTTVAYSKLKDNIPPKTFSSILKQAGLK